MFLQIYPLIDEQKCYEEVRQIRWPEGVYCPFCHARLINKRGFHTHQAHRQRYSCQACGKQFDNLTGTIFEGHHLPLKTWILCGYFMGLNLSKEQNAAQLDLSTNAVQAMTNQFREGVVDKKSQ